MEYLVTNNTVSLSSPNLQFLSCLRRKHEENMTVGHGIDSLYIKIINATCHLCISTI